MNRGNRIERPERVTAMNVRPEKWIALRRTSRAALLALLVPALLITGCSEPLAESASKPTPVRAQPATTGPATPTLSTNGMVTPKDEMRLSFKSGGVIKAIYVHEGDSIRRGQKLAEIELAEVNAQVERPGNSPRRRGAISNAVSGYTRIR
jgi:multidrug efflux pump subunit AcrA (membrane-fusion protein)